MFMHFCQGKWCCSSVDSVGYPHVPDVPFSSSSSSSSSSALSSLICSSLKSLVLVNKKPIRRIWISTPWPCHIKTPFWWLCGDNSAMWSRRSTGHGLGVAGTLRPKSHMAGVPYTSTFGYDSMLKSDAVYGDMFQSKTSAGYLMYRRWYLWI